MDGFMDTGFHDMMNLGSRLSSWFIIYDIIKLIIIVIVVIVLVKMFINNSKNNNSNRAIDILKERYASGEISEEEYNNKLKNLKS
ncbi:SHOCT domain-containing protein [Senegalia massiliensis]|uniref:SHOCT domain-containing protein n=1 Tax=Senegalia massiliensis TaxID=1720316 RepID=A0A845QUP0_9CLOT|nr:SHOCT domain-containing protein [Senegalia massiliensis]NBI05519.1 SHOCT domain-containing protein [Senegalia massiliensis]